MASEKRKRDKQDTDSPTPQCSICIQEYSNRTFLRPCYHSFCFVCIRHWINITSQCPICRQEISSLVYNIDEDEDTFDEYHLKDKGNKKDHDPPLRKARRYVSPTERIILERSKLYKGKLTPSTYPPPLQKNHSFTIITPEHIPRASIFIKNELPIIYNGMDNYDIIVEDQILQTLLVPFKEKKTVMDDSKVIGALAGWLDDDENVAKRLIIELIAYLKSGLSYKHFVSTAMYKAI
ncbi:hypothetical protein K501DRAFT_297633 [Backusella circina FSU 941]|nr:hypothetical protein K501DRAFT_297633 [Backusella circina FSU 941]